MNIQTSPFTQELKEKIKEGFNEFAIEQMGLSDAQPYQVFHLTENKELKGAAVFRYFWNAVEVKQLYIAKDHRGKGIGTELMNRVQHFARKQGCAFISLNTLSFQALPFYLERGYTLEFTRKGYSHEVEMHYLIKYLNE